MASEFHPFVVVNDNETGCAIMIHKVYREAGGMAFEFTVLDDRDNHIDTHQTKRLEGRDD